VNGPSQSCLTVTVVIPMSELIDTAREMAAGLSIHSFTRLQLEERNALIIELADRIEELEAALSDEEGANLEADYDFQQAQVRIRQLEALHSMALGLFQMESVTPAMVEMARDKYLAALDGGQ